MNNKKVLTWAMVILILMTILMVMFNIMDIVTFRWKSSSYLVKHPDCEDEVQITEIDSGQLNFDVPACRGGWDVAYYPSYTGVWIKPLDIKWIFLENFEAP